MKNKKTISIIIIVAAIFFTISCSVFTEENLENEPVILLAPADGVTTSLSALTFWWDPVPDASGYTLQIVSPNFENAIVLVLDTSITENSFQYALNPGNYEWAVSAYNASSATAYFIHSLTVDTASSLNNQFVLLKNPAENGAVNNNNVSFSWYEISIATEYMLAIKSDNWSGDDAVPIVTTSESEYEVYLEEGVYAWGVMARDDFSSTPFTTRSVIVDVTPPDTPQLVTPAENDSVFTLPYTFSWNRPSASLSDIEDHFEISATESFSGLEVDELIDTTYYELTSLDAGKYYFRLKSADKAGNESAYTTVKSFRINEE